MTPEQHAENIKKIIAFLDDKKAENIVAINVRDRTTITDDMIIATGHSGTQLKALGNYVYAEAKKMGIQVLGMEGDKNPEWILIDLGNILVHLMLPQTRAYYDLESLWTGQDGPREF